MINFVNMDFTKTLYRFALKAELAICGHILNPLWLPRKERHDRRERVQARTAVKYFSRYYLGTLDGLPDDAPVHSSEEKIYSIWFQGKDKAPLLVKACHDSVRKHCTQAFEVMDLNTVLSVIDLPQEIIDKFRLGKIKAAHFADICRVELLHRFGGFWMDSTDFVTAPIPESIAEEDFFMFMTSELYGSPYSFVQNCFIHARRGSYLLEAWRSMILDFWKHENSSFDYFQHQLMFKTMVTYDPRAGALFEKMPHINQDPTHILWETIREKPYDRAEYEDITKDAFFQKLSFKRACNPAPGTTLHEMINNPNFR